MLFTAREPLRYLSRIDGLAQPSNGFPFRSRYMEPHDGARQCWNLIPGTFYFGATEAHGVKFVLTVPRLGAIRPSSWNEIRSHYKMTYSQEKGGWAAPDGSLYPFLISSPGKYTEDKYPVKFPFSNVARPRVKDPWEIESIDDL